MKLKATGLFLAIAMLVGMVALPAAANTVGDHVGVFQAEARVGKIGSCNQDGTGSATGGGIGLLPELPPNRGKNAWFTISNGAVTDLSSDGGLQTGVANLCGRLTAPLYPVVDLKDEGIGATCLATKGWGGKGKAVIGSEELWIKNLGWKITVGGTFLVTGDVSNSSDKSKKVDLLLAQVQALSEGAAIGCANKTLVGKTGSQPFIVAAAYEIIPGAGGNVPKKAPKK